MEKILKSNKGITLTVLIITIVLLSILATVTVNISRDSLATSKKYNFTSELEMVLQKIVIINKEIELGTTAYESIGTKYANLDSIKKEKVESILSQNGITNYSSYIYMSKEDLSKIGLKNIEQNVIISYANLMVLSYDGVNINGNIYYSLQEVSTI